MSKTADPLLAVISQQVGESDGYASKALLSRVSNRFINASQKLLALAGKLEKDVGSPRDQLDPGELREYSNQLYAVGLFGKGDPYTAEDHPGTLFVKNRKEKEVSLPYARLHVEDIQCELRDQLGRCASICHEAEQNKRYNSETHTASFNAYEALRDTLYSIPHGNIFWSLDDVRSSKTLKVQAGLEEAITSDPAYDAVALMYDIVEKIPGEEDGQRSQIVQLYNNIHAVQQVALADGYSVSSDGEKKLFLLNAKQGDASTDTGDFDYSEFPYDLSTVGNVTKKIREFLEGVKGAVDPAKFNELVDYCVSFTTNMEKGATSIESYRVVVDNPANKTTAEVSGDKRTIEQEKSQAQLSLMAVYEKHMKGREVRALRADALQPIGYDQWESVFLGMARPFDTSSNQVDQCATVNFSGKSLEQIEIDPGFLRMLSNKNLNHLGAHNIPRSTRLELLCLEAWAAGYPVPDPDLLVSETGSVFDLAAENSVTSAAAARAVLAVGCADVLRDFYQHYISNAGKNDKQYTNASTCLKNLPSRSEDIVQDITTMFEGYMERKKGQYHAMKAKSPAHTPFRSKNGRNGAKSAGGFGGTIDPGLSDFTNPAGQPEELGPHYARFMAAQGR